MDWKKFVAYVWAGAATLGIAWAGSESLVIEPDAGRTPALDLIASASNTLTLTIYELTDPEIVAAIGARATNGVDVRIIHNYYSFEHMGRPDPNADAVQQLMPLGVHVRKAAPHFAVTHQKTLVADGQRALIMTFNLVPSYFGGTRDFGVLTTDSAAVMEIAQTFEADWNGTTNIPQVAALVWSPSNSRAKITALINAATKTLEVYNEEVEDSQISQALIEARRRGVAVRFICAYLGKAGEPDKNQANKEMLRQNGVDARTGTFLYIHAKMVLADYGTETAGAYLGSENFSPTSLDRNRELGIILQDPVLLGQLHRTFEADWLLVPDETPPVAEPAAAN